MIRSIPENQGVRGKPETELERVIRDYLGSADPDLEKRVESLIHEISQKSRPVYEIARDLLRERFRRYDLDAKLIDDRIIQLVAKSLEALISYVDQKNDAYLGITLDSHTLYVSEKRRNRDLEERGGDEKSAARIMRKIKDTLGYIDHLILKKSKEALRPQNAFDQDTIEEMLREDEEDFAGRGDQRLDK